MNSRTIVAILVLAIAPMLTMVASVDAQGAQQSKCEKSSQRMKWACKADTQDDYFETVAHCLNLTGSASNACWKDARKSRGENTEECSDVYEARLEACDALQEDRYDPDPLLNASIEFINPDEVPGGYPANPYVSIAAGHTYVLAAGEDGEETVIVTVTDETREIQGVDCRVIVDVEIEAEEEDDGIDYEPVEVTDDWFAQDTVGNVYYCGEVARNFEDGVLRDLDGSFESGVEYAKAGILINAYPVAGDTHRTEFLLGEAEDIIAYVDLATAPTADEGGDNELFPCSPNHCLKTFDYAPLEPESTEFKYYLPGTGFVLAIEMEDGEITGEREELVCIGDSIEILSDPACGIDDPEELLEELCEVAPDAFCNDDDD